MSHPTRTYRHTQRAPTCLIIYASAGVEIALAVVLHPVPVAPWVLAGIRVLLLLAAAFHHLTVADEGDRLAVAFGPLPLFRRTLRYHDIRSVAVGQTTWLEGWGIHFSPRGGWVWNLWGWDCVVVRSEKSILRIGTSDAVHLAAFLRARIGQESPGDAA